MKKIKNIRLVMLLVAAGLVALGLVLSILVQHKVSTYRNELDDALTAAGNKVTDTAKNSTSSLGTIIAAGVSLLFYVFALLFIFNKSAKVQNRKWPYITMIILGGLGVLLKLVSYAMIYNKAQPTPLEGGLDTAANRQIVEHVWSTYKSSVTTLVLVGIVLSVVIIGLHITQLVLIKKAKNSADIDYSEQIRNFQPQNNDLP